MLFNFFPRHFMNERLINRCPEYHTENVHFLIRNLRFSDISPFCLFVILLIGMRHAKSKIMPEVFKSIVPADFSKSNTNSSRISHRIWNTAKMYSSFIVHVFLTSSSLIEGEIHICSFETKLSKVATAFSTTALNSSSFPLYLL